MAGRGSPGERERERADATPSQHCAEVKACNGSLLCDWMPQSAFRDRSAQCPLMDGWPGMTSALILRYYAEGPRVELMDCGGHDWHWAGGAGPEDAWSVGNVMSGLAGIVCRLGWGGHDVSRSSRTLGWYWDENRSEKYGRRARTSARLVKRPSRAVGHSRLCTHPLASALSLSVRQHVVGRHLSVREIVFNVQVSGCPYYSCRSSSLGWSALSVT